METDNNGSQCVTVDMSLLMVPQVVFLVLLICLSLKHWKLRGKPIYLPISETQPSYDHGLPPDSDEDVFLSFQLKTNGSIGPHHARSLDSGILHVSSSFKIHNPIDGATHALAPPMEQMRIN